jgi:hypothetical protein
MFQLNRWQRAEASAQLRRVLETIPTEDLSGLMASAVEHGDSTRNSRIHRHVLRLLKEGEKQLRSGKPYDVYLYVLSGHNHGHSGWVDGVDSVYMSPRTRQERVDAKKLWVLMEKTARALLRALPEIQSTFEGYMDQRRRYAWAIFGLLMRLGAKVPPTLIAQFKLQLEVFSKDPTCGWVTDVKIHTNQCLY